MAAVTIRQPRSPGRPAGPSTRRAAPRRPSPSVSPAVRRRRLAAVGIGALLVVGAARAAVALGGDPPATPGRPPAATQPAGGAVVTHVVEPGDTLWAIAAELAPGEDPRPLVDELAAAHGDGPLVPGETITWQP